MNITDIVNGLDVIDIVLGIVSSAIAIGLFVTGIKGASRKNKEREEQESDYHLVFLKNVFVWLFHYILLIPFCTLSGLLMLPMAFIVSWVLMVAIGEGASFQSSVLSNIVQYASVHILIFAVILNVFVSIYYTDPDDEFDAFNHLDLRNVLVKSLLNSLLIFSVLIGVSFDRSNWKKKGSVSTESHWPLEDEPRAEAVAYNKTRLKRKKNGRAETRVISMLLWLGAGVYIYISENPIKDYFLG